MKASQRHAAPVAANDAAIGTEIAGLADLDLDALRLRWRNLFGRAAPSTLPRPLLARLIAYRRQAEVLGDLPPKTLAALRLIASGTSGSLGRAVRSVDRRGPPPGTMMLREWKGETHRVTVMREGFSWNGVTYASLSRVAREITGVSWNGLVFFGLKRKPKPSTRFKAASSAKTAVAS